MATMKKQNKFYIYHIEGVKIGCSVNADIRVKEQGYNEYEILETHNDIYKASDREIELQKQYGYAVDKIPYYVSIQHFNKAKQKLNYFELGKRLGNWGVNSGHLIKVCTIGGKTQGKINTENGHMEKMRSKSNYNRKSIKAYNRFTNELVGEYNSLTECCNKLGLVISKVSSTLAGNRKYHKSYTFEWNLK
jgi:hypothetical protein